MTVDQATTVICDAEVDGAVVDVVVEAGRIRAIGRDLRCRGMSVVDAGRGALIRGLHDHHLHLLAMAAADRSLDVAPAAGPTEFDAALRAARRDGTWLRVVGYEDRHGPLDRARLDRLAPGRMVRVQHRSGAAWVVSTPGLAAIGVTSDDGWLHRVDAELGRRWAGEGAPDLAPVGQRLAAFGVTGVTDATPFTDSGGFALLAAARTAGDLPQRVVVTGGPALAEAAVPPGLGRGGLGSGPVKVVVADHAVPSPDELIAAFRRARRAGRPVAVHCVTRLGLVLALTAWEAVGAVAGDRIEHGSVVPVELIAPIAALGIAVVTQPAFVRARGDRYLDEVEADDRSHLYRCATLIDAGVGVGGSTDAPFGPADPWLAMQAAVDRRTATGQVVGPGESVTPRQALDLFGGPPDAPGAARRPLAVGDPADVVLVDGPLAGVLADLSADRVRATWIAGRLCHGTQ